MTGHRVPERPRRHTGEIVDAIWEAELPAVMDERDKRAAAVAEPVARLVLMAMARFTNPTRDQVYGPTREWRCWASVATIAELAGASERQVQRVLRVFEREHYIERVDQGRRPGRPRKGEEPGQARPSTWCLRPDQWRQRPLRNRTGVVAISNDQRNSLPVPAEVPSTPVGLPGNGTGTGREGAEIVPVSSPEPGTPGTLNSGEQKNKPAHAAARAHSFLSIDELKTDDRANGHQVALPLTSAVGLSTPPGLGPVATAPAVDVLTRAKPEPVTKACPDCGRAVTAAGAGHRGGTDPCRAYGRSADVERCPSCPEWIDKRQPVKWHSIRCPIRRQLLEDTAAETQIDQVADGALLERAVVPLSAEDSALADELQHKLEQVRATENGEHMEEVAPARPSRRRRERVAG